MKREKIKVTLVTGTQFPLATIGLGVDILRGVGIKKYSLYHNSELDKKFRWAMDQKNKSPFLHASFTFLIEGASKEWEKSMMEYRGALWLCTKNPGLFSCTYKHLIDLMREKLCVSVSQEWKEIAEGIQGEIAIKLPPVFLEPFDCACKRMEEGETICKNLNCAVDRGGMR